jgi:hypothetical protein
MKRSIYAKTSKPHLPDQKTIYQELAFNDPFFENVKHPLSPGRSQLAEFFVFRQKPTHLRRDS